MANLKLSFLLQSIHSHDATFRDLWQKYSGGDPMRTVSTQTDNGQSEVLVVQTRLLIDVESNSSQYVYDSCGHQGSIRKESLPYIPYGRKLQAKPLHLSARPDQILTKSFAAVSSLPKRPDVPLRRRLQIQCYGQVLFRTRLPYRR
jgi:hypothetical protein